MRYIPLFPCTFLLLSACEKDDREVDYLALLGDMPNTTYHNEELLGEPAALYGAWGVVGSSASVSGDAYIPEFEQLLIKPKGIFGMVRDGALICRGRVECLTDPEYELVLDLIPEQAPASIICTQHQSVALSSDTLRFHSLDFSGIRTNFQKIR